jgi:hypothetical protein
MGQQGGAMSKLLGIGELTIEVSARSCAEHYQSVRKVIEDGKLTADEYLDLTVELLDQSLANVPGKVTLGGCGLLRYEESAIKANDEKSSTFKLHFGVSSIDLVVTPG